MIKFFIWIFVGVLSVSGCSKPKQGTTSSAYMVDILEKIAEQNHTYRYPYMHELRIAHYDSLWRQAVGGENKLDYHYKKSMALLNAGQSVEAAKSFQDLYTALLEYRDDYPDAVNARLKDLESLIAVSYLRQGEQENCIINHTSASCIIPIAEAGFHQLPDGSSQAIETYTRILEKTPDALDARWLLNIAHMTLGKYPEQVPKEWLIPTEAFASEYPLKQFRDIAPQLGLATRALSGGTVIEDFNQDGYLDIMVTSWGLQDQMQYFQHNGIDADGKMSFTEKTQQAGLGGLVSGLNMIHADYNNDGLPDVFVLRGAWLEEHGRHPNSLLRNNGPSPDGVPTFTDVTQEVGLLEFMPTQTAVWSDFNNDGWIDLLIGNETPKDKFHKFPTRLYLNQGSKSDSITFTEVAEVAGIKMTEYVKGVTAGDYDNDGWADVYISTLEGQNFLFRNTGVTEEGSPYFVDVTEEAGLREEIKTFPTWFWDYNNDGWLDIFVSGYNRGTAGSIAHQVAAEHLNLPFEADMPRLYQNNGASPAKQSTFTDVTQEVNLHQIMHTMGSNFGDLDNDGYLDMFLGTGDPDFRSIIPNLVFRNHQGKAFQNVTTAGGFGNLQKGHAVAFADLDHDGDQDIFVNMGGANYGDVYQNSLFKNPYSDNTTANHWIALQLVGTESNRMAIGARIKIVVIEQGKLRSIFREVNAGGSFGGNTLRQEIGLGSSTVIDTLQISWPVSETIQTFTNVKANQFLIVTEGLDKLKTKGFPPRSL
ncbi:MAG: CRTAC1 family protein [Bacteroidota bacterium]